MTVALTYACFLLAIATDADNSTWQYTPKQRILDTQLVTTSDTPLLAVLLADRKLVLLDTDTGQVATELTTRYSMLGFAEPIPTHSPTEPAYLTPTTLTGCQPFKLQPSDDAWRLEPEAFISVIDRALPQDDPEFNDRLLQAWQCEQHLITLTRRGQLTQYDLARGKIIKTRQLHAIGALRHVTAPDCLAIAYKQRATVTLMVLNPADIHQFFTTTLPEVTIPRQLALSATAVVAHYADRGYVVPLLTQSRWFCPLMLIDDWPVPSPEKPPLPPELNQFKSVTQHHTLPDAIILVTDQTIVRPADDRPAQPAVNPLPSR